MPFTFSYSLFCAAYLKKNGFVKDKFVPKITLAVRPIPKQIA